MGRCAVTESVQQETELLPRFFFWDTEKIEDFQLDFWIVISDGTAGDLPAVDHQIVGQ